MIAIETKYLGATNTRGSRIMAKANGNKITIPYPHEAKNPYAVAAIKLCQKLGWKGSLIEGGIDSGSVFVFADSDQYSIEGDQCSPYSC